MGDEDWLERREVRGYFPLACDLEDANRGFQSFERNLASVHEGKSFHRLSEVDDPVAGQNLATSRDRAETGSEVERSAVVSASHRDCFSCVQPHPDAQRKSWI